MASTNGNGSLNGNGNAAALVKAVVLAGGRGTRLAPYTSVLPKPLMPVGERAILELVVDQLESCGITDVTFCVGYLAHLIQSVFDNRANGHVSIEYVHEQEALGTAAPLRLVDGLDDTFLVMNGDVLTELDYRDLLRYHHEHGNMLTIATRHRSIKVDYGILRLDVTQRVRDFEEKPEIVSPVSMGIYVMEPEVLEYIPEGEYFDFPHLVEALLDAGKPIGSYRYDGLWFDIGRHEDYEQAVSAWVESQNEANDHATNGNGTNGNGKVRHLAAVRSRSNGSNGNGKAPKPRAAKANGAKQNGAKQNGAKQNGAKANGNGQLGAPVRWKKPDDRGDGVRLDAFKETLSSVPAPVTIVTTVRDGNPHGTTVSAFSSLSAEPPLVLVALDRSSDLLALLKETGRFAINLLSSGQEELGLACAKKGPEKFQTVPWHEDLGLPRIDGAAAWLACDVQELLPGGDHIIVVGLVTACETGEDEALVYHRRRFLQLA
jgi:flavin reductase (DIM6/NTAB) family NADH-FMN oxidoreductase RutF/dTDP-glucose pyrophosphorylase